MTLAAGARLGPYVITGPCAAGGMGEVYRAHDPGLGRDLAVKVLPPELAHDPGRRARFEQEARAASALNHPHIVAVHAIGSDDGRLYLAMELVEGPTLREMMAGGPLPIRRLLAVAAQVADGLARAHEAGIVHRDLKPENVMVSRDGYAKILDFGLAKLAPPLPGAEEVSAFPTRSAHQTQPGTVLGTAAYMSPEQAAGRPVDFRSDQFSLGAILYEMVSGQRAFLRQTTAETLAAIIRDEPEPLARVHPAAPAPLRWVIERCLAKDPEDRYASTRDLARDLQGLRDHLSEASLAAEVAPARRTSRRRLVVTLAAGAVLGAAALSALRPAPGPPAFERVTYRRGAVTAARFAPDGTIVYAAGWEGEPVRVYSARRGRPESKTLDLPEADLLAVSSNGELALSLQSRRGGAFVSRGVLARVHLGGGPRPVRQDVDGADWSPDGTELAIVHEASARARLEYPIGTTLAETTGWIASPRVSPSGDRVAFIDQPRQREKAGAVVVVDRRGRKRVLSEGWTTLLGLAWGPGGREVWFAGARHGSAPMLHAVTLSREERLVASAPGGLGLLDVDRDGRALVTQFNFRIGLRARLPGQAPDRELSWLDWSMLRGLSADGRSVLFEESGEGAGRDYGIYLRDAGGEPPVRLGDGSALALSPDGALVLARSGQTLSLLPTGPGPTRLVDAGEVTVQGAAFLPDGRGLVLRGHQGEAGPRLWVLPAAGGPPRAVTPEGLPARAAVVTPDGRGVLAQGPDGRFRVYPLAEGEPQELAGLQGEDSPMRWSADGRALYFRPGGGPPWLVRRLDVASGRKDTVHEIAAGDRAGLLEILAAQVTPDGATLAYSYSEGLSTLYLVDGLR